MVRAPELSKKTKRTCTFFFGGKKKVLKKDLFPSDGLHPSERRDSFCSGTEILSSLFKGNSETGIAMFFRDPR